MEGKKCMFPFNCRHVLQKPLHRKVTIQRNAPTEAKKKKFDLQQCILDLPSETFVRVRTYS